MFSNKFFFSIIFILSISTRSIQAAIDVEPGNNTGTVTIKVPGALSYPEMSLTATHKEGSAQLVLDQEQILPAGKVCVRGYYNSTSSQSSDYYLGENCFDLKRHEKKVIEMGLVAIEWDSSVLDTTFWGIDESIYIKSSRENLRLSARGHGYFNKKIPFFSGHYTAGLSSPTFQKLNLSVPFDVPAGKSVLVALNIPDLRKHIYIELPSVRFPTATKVAQVGANGRYESVYNSKVFIHFLKSLKEKYDRDFMQLHKTDIDFRPPLLRANESDHRTQIKYTFIPHEEHRIAINVNGLIQEFSLGVNQDIYIKNLEALNIGKIEGKYEGTLKVEYWDEDSNYYLPLGQFYEHLAMDSHYSPTANVEFPTETSYMILYGYKYRIRSFYKKPDSDKVQTDEIELDLRK